jgi:16S rRNA G966 N2-methylase RsmD
MVKYSAIQPIDFAISADRQSAKRHYGVHPYFTRRPHNVVRQYLTHYSDEGDRVLDPFGGSGVTAIEAFLENRVGIQNDINPLANFIAAGIVNLHRGNLADYECALRMLREGCQAELGALYQLSVDDVERLKKKLTMPDNIRLPKTSDVERYHELFSPRQLAALAILRDAIEAIPSPPARDAMVLAWSATLAKLNRTFLSAEGRAESRGGSSIFSIYRYKIAKDPVELAPWKTFEERAQNVLSAKEEIDKAIEIKSRTNGWHGQFEIHDRDIDDLGEEFQESVDYIFTDPPYGGHISYLDLSVMWNCWLNQMPSVRASEQELIVGGELRISESTYTNRLGKSIATCIKMLKPGRWLSVVFQHWNTAYFDAILTSAAETGADLRAAVPQVGDTVWSMHKKKGNESVLAGELILTFFKTGEPRTMDVSPHDFDIEATMSQILSGVNARFLYGESVFNQLIVAAWKKGAIKSLDISKGDFNDLIKGHGWQYEDENHYWVRERSEGLLFA